jgi:hypothetical protein
MVSQIFHRSRILDDACVFQLFMLRLFRCPDSTVESGLVPNGKRILREHSAMIRGMVPKDRLLEWAVEDGWEPLCQVCSLCQLEKK